MKRALCILLLTASCIFVSCDSEPQSNVSTQEMYQENNQKAYEWVKIMTDQVDEYGTHISLGSEDASTIINTMDMASDYLEVTNGEAHDALLYIDLAANKFKDWQAGDDAAFGEAMEYFRSARDIINN